MIFNKLPAFTQFMYSGNQYIKLPTIHVDIPKSKREPWMTHKINAFRFKSNKIHAYAGTFNKTTGIFPIQHEKELNPYLPSDSELRQALRRRLPAEQYKDITNDTLWYIAKELGKSFPNWQHTNYDPHRLTRYIITPEHGLVIQGSLSGRLSASELTVTGTNSNERKTKEQTMSIPKQSHLITLLQEDMITCDVRFEGSCKTYVYKMASKSRVFYRNLLEKDEPVFLIVPPNKKRDFPAIAELIEVHDTPQIDLDAPYAYEWIVDRVNMDEYLFIKDREKRAGEILLHAERVQQKKRLMESLGVKDGNEAVEQQIKELLNAPANEG